MFEVNWKLITPSEPIQPSAQIHRYRIAMLIATESTAVCIVFIRSVEARATVLPFQDDCACMPL